jgi:hypothetical protein
MKKEKVAFWLTNISNRNVSLADLNLTIKAFSSVNLLDSKHYSYTKEQVEASVNSGSVYNKRDKIKTRKEAPKIIKMDMPVLRETFIPTRERSTLSIKEEYYEELSLSDEQFAIDNADIADLETQKPIIKR